MCLRILFTPLEEDLTRAQWRLVEELQRAIGAGWRYAKSSRQLRQLLWQAREQADSPPAWARAFAQALLEALAAAQEAKEAQPDVELLELRLASFQRIVAEYNANPLQAQVKMLTQERDQWQAQANQQAERIQSLETTLAQSRQMHREEVARLKGEIAGLNQLIVQQQEELMRENG